MSVHRCPKSGCDEAYEDRRLIFAHFITRHPLEYVRLKRRGVDELIRVLPGVEGSIIIERLRCKEFEQKNSSSVKNDEQHASTSQTVENIEQQKEIWLQMKLPPAKCGPIVDAVNDSTLIDENHLPLLLTPPPILVKSETNNVLDSLPIVAQNSSSIDEVVHDERTAEYFLNQDDDDGASNENNDCLNRTTSSQSWFVVDDAFSDISECSMSPSSSMIKSNAYGSTNLNDDDLELILPPNKIESENFRSSVERKRLHSDENQSPLNDRSSGKRIDDDNDHYKDRRRYIKKERKPWIDSRSDDKMNKRSHRNDHRSVSIGKSSPKRINVERRHLPNEHQRSNHSREQTSSSGRQREKQIDDNQRQRSNRDSSFPSIPCLFCFKLFSSATEILDHEFICHKNVRRYNCPLCFENKLSSTDNVQKHLETVHKLNENKNKKTLTCGLCLKNYPLWMPYLKHIESDYCTRRLQHYRQIETMPVKCCSCFEILLDDEAWSEHRKSCGASLVSKNTPIGVRHLEKLDETSCLHANTYCKYFPTCPLTCSFAHAKCKFDLACRSPIVCRWYHSNQDKKTCVICKK